MLNAIRTSRKTSLSRPASLRSSIDEGPSKAPSTTKSGQLRALGSSQPILTHEGSYETSQATSNSLTSNPSASAHAIPFGSLQTSSVKPYRTHPRDSSPHFSQKSSGISKLSPSFVTAQGELHAPGSRTDIEENRGCVGQMDIVDGPRGPRNPHGLSHDNSIGYFPKGFEVMLGTAGQTDTIQSNDPPSFDDLLRMIAAERLHYMPQKGSNWDRSIRALESFAFKVSGSAGRYTSVVSNSQFTATMLYGRSSVLLQLGRNRVASLVPALEMLAAMSSGLSLFASFPSGPTISSQLQQHLGQILDRTLDLLNGITSCFQDIPIGLDAATGPSLFRRSLKKQLEAFDLQAAQLLGEMWNSYIPSDVQEPILKFEQVQSLLQPQDEAVRMTQKILLADKGTRHEFSCEWLSEQFLDFVRSSDSTLWIDGSIGCGKSVLCGWIMESLQSPINGREYAVIAYAIDPLLPSEANTACVIKALLRQLVERRYGSSNVCRALAKLSSTMTTTDFPVQNENALLECLQITIGNVIQPTMLVIDGLSELDGGETAATTLFHALLNCVAGNPLVRLLVLSRPFEFFPVTPLRRKTIQAGDVLMDIHNVITDLVPSHTQTPSVEIARKILHEADGSFLWSLLTLQDWAAHDFSLQTWSSLPTSLDANIALLVSKIDLSDPTTCGVLFNVVIATRPLRVAEIEFISRLDVNNQTLKPQAPDVKRAVEDACGSMLIIQDGIVLFRHALLKQVLLETLQFGILSLGPEVHGDMACRLLLYIKLVLGQRSELTMKSIPSSTMADLLRSHPLLSYALRYWTQHAVASVMYNGSSFKPSSACTTVFPDSIYAATVEASFWTQNVSSASIQALNIAASARKEILGNNEATVQTVVFLAEALRIAKDYGGAVVNSALAFELSQLILPVSHPFAAACMSQFLDGSDLDVLKQPGSNDSASVPALRRLIEIHSREKSWDQASEAYSCLWNAFLVKDDLDFSTFRALFFEYTGFLKRQKADNVHEIIVSYRAACLANFGERDPVTLEASLLLAESWNNGYPDSTSIEAVRLYEGIVDGDEGYSPQGIALVEIAEERLAKIYEDDINGHYMQGETLLRAIRLQGKKYQIGKTREGAYQPATLSSLAIWVSMLTKQKSPDSKALAVREMQSAIESVIESGAQPTSLYSTAVILANLFAANGYVEEGLTTVQSLTEQALFEHDDTEQQARRSILFLAAFEAHLTGSMVDFAGIHARLLMVSALWDSYKRLSQEGTQPEATLACGAKLRSFLIEHNFHHTGALIEDDLFQRFQDYYGATSAVREFFCSMLPELSSERLHIDIPDLASTTFYQYVGSFLEQGDYQSALNIGLSGIEFVCFVGGFATNLEKGLELGLKLAHTDGPPVPDQPVAAQMMDLSKRILQETLRECRSQSFNFNMLNIDFVSRIASVLGLQQNYEDLEWLLTRLWLSRKNLTSISPDVIVTIGRRLVEVRFFHGHVDSAIELGEDILYNVQRVYGTSHPSTVDIANFLSSIYVANGDEAAALAVVGDVSHLKVPGTKGHSTKFDQPKTANAAKPNIGYLLQFYHRNNDAEKPNRSTGRAQRLSEEVEDSRDAGDIVRAGQQPPASWGFIDRSGERGSGVIGLKR